MILKVVRKILSIIGILACLSAAEGLHRFGGFIEAMGGQDAPFYMGILIVSLVAAVFFILALVGKLSGLMKWLAVVVLAASTGLMFIAPALPVIGQIGFSLMAAVLCMIFAPVAVSTVSASDANPAPAAPSKFGKIVKYVVIAIIIIVVALGILGNMNKPDKPQDTTQTTQERTR